MCNILFIFEMDQYPDLCHSGSISACWIAARFRIRLSIEIWKQAVFIVAVLCRHLWEIFINKFIKVAHLMVDVNIW